jgi:hypothetical protein
VLDANGWPAADVSRGLRNGQWRFAIDIDRAFWGML